jgi:hypothetical protein
LVADSRGERQTGDQDGGDQRAGERLKDTGERESPGVAAGNGGGDLGGEGNDQNGPRDPDHCGEGVDEGLRRDPLAVEGSANLGGGREVMREGPADEVPERPGNAGRQGEN